MLKRPEKEGRKINVLQTDEELGFPVFWHGKGASHGCVQWVCPMGVSMGVFHGGWGRTFPP